MCFLLEDLTGRQTDLYRLCRDLGATECSLVYDNKHRPKPATTFDTPAADHQA